MLLAIVSLMCVSFLSLECFKIYQIRRGINLKFRSDDMYYKDNYNKMLCMLNEYFYGSGKSIEELKENIFFVYDKIEFFYDDLEGEFYIKYRYKGIVYKKAINYISNDKGIIFIPKEKKYIKG